MENQNLKKVEKKTLVLLLKILTVLNFVIGCLTILLYLLHLAEMRDYTVLLTAGIAILVSTLFLAAITRITIAAELYIANNKEV